MVVLSLLHADPGDARRLFARSAYACTGTFDKAVATLCSGCGTWVNFGVGIYIPALHYRRRFAVIQINEYIVPALVYSNFGS